MCFAWCVVAVILLSIVLLQEFIIPATASPSAYTTSAADLPYEPEIVSISDITSADESITNSPTEDTGSASDLPDDPDIVSMSVITSADQYVPYVFVCLSISVSKQNYAESCRRIYMERLGLAAGNNRLDTFKRR